MNKYQLTLVVLVVLLFTYVISQMYLSYLFTSSSEETRNAMEAEKFACPNGMALKIEAWGKLGYSRICAELKNGKWQAWEDGYKKIDGRFLNGKKVGTWTWYDSDGSISNEKEYPVEYEVGLIDVNLSDDIVRNMSKEDLWNIGVKHLKWPISVDAKLTKEEIHQRLLEAKYAKAGDPIKGIIINKKDISE